MTKLPSDIWIRPANGGEISAAMPFMGSQSRVMRPPEMMSFGQAGNPRPAFIAGFLPDPDAPMDGHNFQIETLAVWPSDADSTWILETALAQLASQMSADNWTTPLTCELSVEVPLLKTCGFKVSAISHQLESDIATNRARLARLMGPVQKWIARRGISLVPYGEVSGKMLETIHMSNLGEVPEGFFIMTGRLDSEKDYSPSFAAIKDGDCLGLIVGAYDVDELFVEAIIVTEQHRGSPLAAILCGSLAFHPIMHDTTKVSYIVPAAYKRQLEFVKSLGATPIHDWVKLAKVAR